MKQEAPQADLQRKRIAIAGASGFVGTHVRRRMASRFPIRALTRSANRAASSHEEDNSEWRRCDLYSLPQLTEAIRGCTHAIYLVHSMAPSSRLVQASFEDTDLLLADNFIRAAEAAGVQHVIYLGGQMPGSETIASPHLNSRREVEQVLGSRSVTLTVLRAGLILGPGGSSFSLLVNLVRRLPVMLFPSWTRSTTQSIDIADSLPGDRLLPRRHLARRRLLRPGLPRFDDLSGPYPDDGRPFGKAPPITRPSRPFLRLSKRWISIFGEVPIKLAGPLMESLKYHLRAKSNPLLERIRPQAVSFEVSLRRSTDASGRPKPIPGTQTKRSDARHIKSQRRVQSVQRMGLGGEVDAHDLSREYGAWFSRVFVGLIQVERGADQVIRFRALGRFSLLELAPTPYSMNDQRRCAFYTTGGALSRDVEPAGRLEFRVFSESKCLIASIHGFAPTLPWWIYCHTQALAHLWVMRSFAHYLKRSTI